MTTQVWECGRCPSTYATEEDAQRCEDAHPKREQFTVASTLFARAHNFSLIGPDAARRCWPRRIVLRLDDRASAIATYEFVQVGRTSS